MKQSIAAPRLIRSDGRVRCRHVDVRERRVAGGCRAPPAPTRAFASRSSSDPRRIVPPAHRAERDTVPDVDRVDATRRARRGSCRRAPAASGGDERAAIRRDARSPVISTAPGGGAGGRAAIARPFDATSTTRRRARTYAAGVYSVTVIVNVPGRDASTVACSTHGSCSIARDRAGVDEQQRVAASHAGARAYLGRELT